KETRVGESVGSRHRLQALRRRGPGVPLLHRRTAESPSSQRGRGTGLGSAPPAFGQQLPALGAGGGGATWGGAKPRGPGNLGQRRSRGSPSPGVRLLERT
ncbi:unnamed protein product, partial [Rangifer tarandus platyrhynchus]